jgi:hypothetical protein
MGNWNWISRGGRRLVPRVPPAPPPKQPLSAAGALRPETLEHGAYYAGKLGSARGVARWHAKKHRFVYAEYSLGTRQVRTAAHIDEGGTPQVFVPVARIEPKDNHRVSDYAFETAG